MTTIDKLHNPTIFTKDQAESIANDNNNSDDDWSYQVESHLSGFIVVVFDENKNRLGAL